MEALERFASLEDALREVLDAARAKIWTTLPGIIVSFDAEAVTATVQPALQGVVQSQDGTVAAVNLPLLIHVPVQFPRGGGVTLTFPIQPGDECTVNFSCRCIDGWWQSGGVQLPMDTRMHDLSDAFCTVGPQSQTKKIAGISTTSAQLRTDDGQAFIDLNPADHAVRVTTTGDVAVTAGGALTAAITGNATATVGGSATVNVSGGATIVVGGFLNATAANARLQAASISLVGNVSITGTLAVAGLASLNGGFGALPRAGGGANVISSPVQITGQTTLAGVTAGGKDIGPAHTHSNGNGGSPTGGVI